MERGEIPPDPSRRLQKYRSIRPGNGLLSGIPSFFVPDLIPSWLGPCEFISATNAFLVKPELDNPSQTSHLLLLWTPDLLSQVFNKVRTSGWKPQTKEISIRKLNTSKPLTNRAKHQQQLISTSQRFSSKMKSIFLGEVTETSKATELNAELTEWCTVAWTMQ